MQLGRTLRDQIVGNVVTILAELVSKPSSPAARVVHKFEEVDAYGDEG